VQKGGVLTAYPAAVFVAGGCLSAFSSAHSPKLRNEEYTCVDRAGAGSQTRQGPPRPISMKGRIR
jgi:hypothetical protein